MNRAWQWLRADVSFSRRLGLAMLAIAFLMNWLWYNAPFWGVLAVFAPIGIGEAFLVRWEKRRDINGHA